MHGRAYTLALEPPYNPRIYRGLMLVLNSLFNSCLLYTSRCV